MVHGRSNPFEPSSLIERFREQAFGLDDAPWLILRIV
jgi:hypothetical protein